MTEKSGKWDSLERVLADVERILNRGVSDFNDAFHWPVLGTVGSDGCQQRTVILRGFDPIRRILICHTDSRAGKAAEIRMDNRVSWLFYHPKRRIQVRITGLAELHTDDLFADEQWAATSAANRLNYSTGEAPGTAVPEPASGLPELFLNKLPSLLESEKSRPHFMTISCVYDSMDCLRLSPLGNRRARFTWTLSEKKATWIVP